MTQTDKVSYVGLVPYELRPKGNLSDIALSELDWPLGRPETGNTVADLGPEDHILVHPNTSLHFAKWGRILCKTSLLIAEPDAIHGKHLTLLRFSHWRFHRILTRSPFALRKFANSRLFVTGATFLQNPDRKGFAKSRMVSLIASGKRDQTGHRLRHDLVDLVKQDGLDVAVLGRGYAPFEHKEDGLAPFHYSVVIENVREPAMFTEKLIDAFLCATVPIYWGAPDIGTWFDPDGMIICETLEDLRTALDRVSGSDYAARRAALDVNRKLALGYADTNRRAASVLLSDAPEVPPFR